MDSEFFDFCRAFFASAVPRSHPGDSADPRTSGEILKSVNGVRQASWEYMRSDPLIPLDQSSRHRGLGPLNFDLSSVFVSKIGMASDGFVCPASFVNFVRCMVLFLFWSVCFVFVLMLVAR